MFPPQFFGISAAGVVCDYPATTNVRSGIVYASGASTGNMTLPAASNVRNAIQYGANGTEFTGTLVVSSSGMGANQVTITITAGGLPVQNGDVWVTSDAEGSMIVAGTLQTDGSGQVLFLLNAGTTYYLWFEKPGYNSINGQAFVAVAD